MNSIFSPTNPRPCRRSCQPSQPGEVGQLDLVAIGVQLACDLETSTLASSHDLASHSPEFPVARELPARSGLPRQRRRRAPGPDGDVGFRDGRLRNLTSVLSVGRWESGSSSSCRMVITAPPAIPKAMPITATPPPAGPWPARHRARRPGPTGVGPQGLFQQGRLRGGPRRRARSPARRARSPPSPAKPAGAKPASVPQLARPAPWPPVAPSAPADGW